MSNDPFIPLLNEHGRPSPIIDLAQSMNNLMKENVNGTCQSINDFENNICNLTEGDFGVSKAVDKAVGEEHALKKMKLCRRKNLPNNSILEMKLLSELSHPNIIAFESIVASSKFTEMYIAMEYCEKNLTQLLKSFSTPFDPPQLKCMMKLLLNGVAYIHNQNIIHRDIAPSNLLISSYGQLKIADFGKAVMWESDRERLCNVGSPGYRALELVIGHKKYTPAIDVWSVGCIFGELLLHNPLFSTSGSDWYQINDIMELWGTSDNGFVPSYLSESKIYVVMPNVKPCYEQVFHDTPASALELLKEFFKYDYTQRIKATTVLSRRYFTEEPFATDPSELQSYFYLKQNPQIRSEPMDISDSLSDGEISNDPM